jgi:hypothetical protein
MVRLEAVLSQVPKCEGPAETIFSGAFHLLGTWGVRRHLKEWISNPVVFRSSPGKKAKARA